jgi:tetratricopeptide (TPR) repeat protein
LIPEIYFFWNNLAALYREQGHYAEAEPLLKRALAIREKALGPDHPDVGEALSNLAALYDEQSRYADALPLVRRTIDNKTAATWAALPVLFGAQAAKLIAVDEAIDGGLNVVQRASQTAAGEALNALAVRFSAGNDRLAQLVRSDQDLAGESAKLDKAIIRLFPMSHPNATGEPSNGSGIALGQSPRNVPICKPCSRASFLIMRRCRTRYP